MIAARIANATRTLGAPAGMTKAECGALAIRDIETAVGPAMESAWEPTPEERLAIAAGANVVIGVGGRVHPPVYVGVGEPPERFTRQPTEEEAIAVLIGARDILNAAGDAITKPSEILDTLRRLTADPYVSALIGGKP